MAEMVRVEEAYIERDETINAQGAVMEIEIPYLVFGSLDGGRIRIIPLYMIGEYDRILRCMSFSCLPVEMSGR